MRRIYFVCFKRILDIFLSIIISILFFPLFLLVSLIIKFFYKSKIFYIHRRVGYFGKDIYIYKFRTMLMNSEEILKEYLQNHPEEKVIWEQNQKLYNDPRVTNFGKMLRTFSIDELPQIFNVFKGDMSLVGPRPIIDKEKNKYKESFELYKSIKPGITGFWQISGRNNLNYEQRVELDVYYIENISFLLDLYVLFKTIPAVIFKKGAY